MEHLTVDQLEEGLEDVRRSPADEGRVDLIVRRPKVDGREVLMAFWSDSSVSIFRGPALGPIESAENVVGNLLGLAGGDEGNWALN